MIIVTGGAGFIGCNLVRALNARGRGDVLVVDDLSDGDKFNNIKDCALHDVVDQSDFLLRLHDAGLPADTEAVFHQGACSDTTERDGRYMLSNNYEYSKDLLEVCLRAGVAFIYASSASVYGLGPDYSEDAAHENPLNVYAYSKCLFDRYVRGLPETKTQVAGLRYFNVYGPREAHKGRMASIVYQLNRQLLEDGELRLFEGTDGYGDGEQERDFIHVDDAVAVNLWLWDHPEVSGVFNCGTGGARSFNDVARLVIAHHGQGRIRYVPFPSDLAGRYQSYTQADVTRLREAGYKAHFTSLEEGVGRYLTWLDERR